MSDHSKKVISFVAGFTFAMQSGNGQVINGDFTGQGANWTTNGNVEFVVIGIHGNGVALFQEPGEGTRPGAGSRARIYQNVDMTGEPSVVFRYQLSVGSGTGEAAVPPDSFTATLYNTTAGRRVVPVLSTDVPDFSNGFYYADSDGEEVYDNSIVSVTGPDGSGMKTVTLSVSTNGTHRVEFGFASADNGIISAAVLDDVASDCATSSAYCCSSSGVATVIDDGKPCTLDTCVGSSGVVTHEPFDCCGACDGDRATDAAIMIMIDVSATMPDDELDATTNAVRQLLNRLRGEPNPPKVGLATYHEHVVNSSQNPTPLVPVDPTTNYDQIESALTDVVTSTAPSNLKNAIEFATTKLTDASLSGAQKYMMLITDGWTVLPRTNPGGGENDSCHRDCCLSLFPPAGSCGTGADCMCGCTPARDSAETAAADAESNGIQIYVAHFVGSIEPGNVRDQCFDPAWRADAIDWMEADIATTPNHIFKNTDVADILVDCAMTSMVELINCDDLDNCTTDTCIQGLCIHTPIAGCTP